jgi:DNA-binding GntR family transcriptional regulator
MTSSSLQRPHLASVEEIDRKPAAATEAASLRDMAYAAIKHRIITCAFKPGEFLNEASVSATLGIGRTPVHQAIDRLMLEGMLDVMPRRGVIVRPVSLNEVMQIIDVRLLNECPCVRLATERADDDEMAHLTDILSRAEQWMPTRNSEQMMLLDREFHATLARACKNTVLSDILGKLQDRSLRFWFLSLTAPGHHASVQEQHMAIVDAMKQRDPNGAEQAMRAHIEAFRSNVARHI